MLSFQSHNRPLHQCKCVIGRGGAAEALPVQLFSTYRYLELLQAFHSWGHRKLQVCIELNQA
jgi:hypothetical protein